MALMNRVYNGKLNLDTQPFRMPEGDFIEALNITRDSPGEAEDIVVTNVIGNQRVVYNLPTGTNKVIGKFPDKLRNRVYYFIWNSFSQDLILYYDRDTDTIITLIRNLVDTDGDILDFNPSKRINHVDIIYRDEGDLVFWTDGNSTPKKMNVTHIQDGIYSTIKEAFIEVAKMPPLTPPVSQYGNDLNRASNALRRKLFQPAYRWEYDDFEKSTFSSYGKIPLPVGYYGSDNDFDNTFNNFITITVETGDENVTAIEIAVRNNIGAAWGDFVLVASLNKEQLGIPDNSTYQFLFYNDGVYPPISDGVQYVNGVQVVPLFDWVPQLADTQSSPNGNVISYGAITENYDNYPVSELDVTMTAENVTNSPPDSDPPAITYTGGGQNFTFTVSGSVQDGTEYTINAYNTMTGFVLASYFSQPGDTINDVATELYNTINPAYAASLIPPSFSVILPGVGAPWSISIVVLPTGGGGSGTISTEKTWLWNATYIFGLVYVDEQNRDMPGVTTYVNPVDSNNDFAVTTPQFSEDGGDPQTPVISASINHLPPEGAVKYYWVRRRQTYGTFLFYETCDVQDDTDFYYFCLANIEKYKEDNSQFIYGSAPITSESRIKIIAGITASAYNGDVWTQDYQILGTVTKTLTGGSSPDDDKLFIKVNKPQAAVSPAYTVNMLVMVYTPALNPTSLADSVYYEWGEAYDIYEDNGVRYHRGMDQDQTASQPAEFTFAEGDVYFHQRTMYDTLLSTITPLTSDTVSLMDANYSDFFDSAVNDNGRAQAIEVNAKQTYNPVLIRHGLEYQSGTNVNETNRFYFENFIEADRQYGDIRKMYIRDRYLRVYQKFKVGIVPILLQIIRDTAGNPLEANSDILLNKINYPYAGNYGIGDVPESFAADNYADYFVDDYRGVVCRLSQDGITVLSIVYECNSFFTSKLPYYRKSLNNGNPPNGSSVYTGDPSVYGVFDAFTNKYIIALEEINRYNDQGFLTFHQDGYTISFNEVRNQMEGFESNLSYKPENMVCLDTLLIAFKDGALWKFTQDAPRCNFFGIQYDAYITGVFNDSGLEKKTWKSVTELSNDVWECPVIYTNVTSYGSTRQQSKLIPNNFARLEGNWSSSILRDINSPGGWVNGSTMKGNYIVIRFLKQNASTLIYLNGTSVTFVDSPLTSK